MGRHRLPEEKKKGNVKLTITKEILDQAKELNLNISKIAEDALIKHLKEKVPATN
jgi:post-segregation antitoxin (ccd killing protein)